MLETDALSFREAMERLARVNRCDNALQVLLAAVDAAHGFEREAPDLQKVLILAQDIFQVWRSRCLMAAARSPEPGALIPSEGEDPYVGR